MAKFLAEREARFAAERERKLEAQRTNYRPTPTTVAERQALALRALLGDRFETFAAYFVSCDAERVKGWVARMAPPVRAATAAGASIAQAIDAAHLAAGVIIDQREAEAFAKHSEAFNKRQVELTAGAL